MASSLTSTSHAVLGLLSIQPWTTYELAKQVERSLGWFWPRSERKIYDEAKKLVAAGLASPSRGATGSRPRTVYAITGEGRAALAEWIGQPSAPPKFESEAQVRVFLADAGSLVALQETVEEVAANARANLDRLHDLIGGAADDHYAFAERRHINAISIRFQLDLHRAMASWAEWAQEQTAAWVDVNDPGDWNWRSALE